MQESNTSGGLSSPYGSFCLYAEKPVLCQERGGCSGCQIFIDAIDNANTGLCPVCGADLANWKLMFNEEHHCEGKEGAIL